MNNLHPHRQPKVVTRIRVFRAAEQQWYYMNRFGLWTKEGGFIDTIVRFMLKFIQKR